MFSGKMKLVNYGTCLRLNEYIPLEADGLNWPMDRNLILETRLAADEQIGERLGSNHKRDSTAVEIKTGLELSGFVTHARMVGNGSEPYLKTIGSGNAVSDHLSIEEWVLARLNPSEYIHMSGGFVSGHRVYLSRIADGFITETKARMPRYFFSEGLFVQDQQVFDIDINSLTSAEGKSEVHYSNAVNGNRLQIEPKYNGKEQLIVIHHAALESVVDSLKKQYGKRVEFYEDSQEQYMLNNHLCLHLGQREYWDAKVAEMLKAAEAISRVITEGSVLKDNLLSVFLTGDLARRYDKIHRCAASGC